MSVASTTSAFREGRRARWPRWVGGFAVLLLALWAALHFGLDPWLRRQLEQQVSRQTAGRYALRVGELRTRLATGSVTLTDVRLRPTDRYRPGPDSLPKLALDLPELYLSGVDLGALWRKTAQHLATLRLTGLRLRIDSLAKASFRSGAPLHAKLPARIPALHLDRLEIRDARALYMGRRRPRLAFHRLDLTGRDLRLDSAGGADSVRLFYARTWQLRLRRGQGLFDHHRGWVKRLDFDSEAGTVAVDSFRMRPTRIGRRGPAYLTMRIGRARLTGWRVPAVRRRHFRADSLRIAALHFDLTAPAKPPPPFHELVSAVFSRLELTDARLTDGYVRLRGLAHAPVIRDLRLHADHLRIDSAAYRDPRRVLYARAWDGSTGAAEVPISPPFYALSYAHLDFATRPGTLRLTKVRLDPRLSITETARRKGHAVTLLTVQVPEVHLTGGDFGAFARENSLRAGTVIFRTPHLAINGDSRYPIDPEESLVTPEAVRKIPFRVDFRRIDIVNCELDFRFIGTVSPRYGRGRVTHLTGTVTNATNDPARMTDATPMTVTATALFQDRCRASATARMNLLDPNGRHRLTGTFGAAPATILNSILEPAALTRIQTGTVQRIDLTMSGDRDGIRGELRGRYQNLHIRLLNSKVAQTLLTKIKSKAANKLIIHDDNPEESDEPLRVGRIESRRERRYSIFALWKQGLVSGALHSIGVGEEKAQRMSETQTEPGQTGAGDSATPTTDNKPPKPVRLLKKLLPGKHGAH